MYIDLNVPVPVLADGPPVQSKKGKGKQPQQPQKSAVSFTPAQLSAIEARIDLLIYRESSAVRFLAAKLTEAA